MLSLQEVYQRLQDKKKQRREMNSSCQDELKNHARYQELCDQMKVLREEKKSIESEILASAGHATDLEGLILDIKSDAELLADIALNLYLDKQSVEIVDDYDQRWVPVWNVRFTKGGYADKQEQPVE